MPYPTSSARIGAPRRSASRALFEHQDARAFADDEAVAVACPRDGWRASGSSLRVDSARIAAKPAMPSGVMLASVPPQIIASA